MKKHDILILLLIFTSNVNLSAQYSIEGVWSLVPDDRLAVEDEKWFFSRELSWGKRYFFRNIYMIIDLHSKWQYLEIREFSWNEILSIVEYGNRTELTFYFDRGDYDVSIVCHFNEDGTMWIEQDNIYEFPVRDRIFYKVDSPEFPEINYHLRSQQNIYDVYIEEDSSDGINTNILTEDIILRNENIAVDNRSNEIIAVSLDQDFIQTDNEDSFINQSSKKWLWLLLLLLIPLMVIVIFLTRKHKK